MIIEPHFPEPFIELVTTIIACQLQVDKLKGQIREEDTEKLFKSIDHLHCGQIFVEDLYAFLKRKGLVLTKKNIKFVNRYFGFSSHGQLSLQLFRNKFVQILNPKHLDEQKSKNPEEALMKMINYALSSYQQIEQLRLGVADSLLDLQSCFKAFFPQSPSYVTKIMLIEVLSCLNQYSRLHHHFVCNYLIGDDSNQISLQQLFWKELNNNYFADQGQEEQKKMMMNNKLNTKEEINKKKQNIDILTQIDNVETAIKIKRQKVAQNRHRILQEDRQKTIQLKTQGNLQSTLLTLPRKKQSFLGCNTTVKQQQYQHIQTDELENIDDIIYSKNIDEILKRSLNDYNQQFEENQRQIEKLYRNRRISKSREEALSRASSCTKLKVQEIEKRVNNNKSKISNTIQTGLRIPMTGEIKHELRSRFSSLKKKI